MWYDNIGITHRRIKMDVFNSLGVMIDCSRDAVPNVVRLKKFIDTVSEMGYNVAMLYTEDTYEVVNEPYFGSKRGKYTVEELYEIDRYAASRGVELVPFIQTLAHLGTLKKWRAYRHKVFDIDDILLVDAPRTYELIDNMFASLRKSFSSKRVHLGYDEAHHIGLGKYLDENGYTDRYELLMRHLERVCEIAKKYGFETMLAADDLFFNMSPGEFCSDEERDFPQKIKDMIPRGLELVHWDYFGTDKKRYTAMMRSAKKLTENVWFSGGAWTWNTFSPHNRYSIKRNEIAVPACRECGVSMAFFTLWGDNGGECAYEAVLPSLMHTAARSRGLSDGEMAAEFEKITGEKFSDFLDLDLPNYIYGENVPVESPYFQHSAANYAKTHLYDDPFYGTMSANLGEVDATVFEKYAKRLYEHAKKNTEYSFLYLTQARLCDALAIKLPLAKKTREIYAFGDKEKILELCRIDYTECIKRVEAFYESFCDQWLKINKPYGLEVHDARLGGLCKRLESCRRRLLDYANGKVSEIPELCEPVLPMDDAYITSWAEMISANPV